MTTIIGLRAEKGLKENRGIVLASDMSGTYEYKDDRGEIIVKRQAKTTRQKIYEDTKGDFVVAMSGIRDEVYMDFLSNLLRGKIELKKALENSYFPELAKLTLDRWGHKKPDKRFNELLIASRFDEQPKLYSCSELGAIEHIKSIGAAIGSGRDYAIDYVNLRMGAPNPKYPGITMKRAIRLAYGAIGKASKDIYTGGEDISTITGKEIKNHGKEINKAVEKTKKQELDKILEDY